MQCDLRSRYMASPEDVDDVDRSSDNNYVLSCKAGIQCTLVE